MSTIQVPVLRPVGMREFAANELRRALLRGAFPAGEDLSEVALSSKLQVSRGPLREALVMLAGEGLLRHHHNRGFSVLNYTEADTESIRQVRIPLEAMALELGRARITAKTLSNLEHFRDRLVATFDEPGGTERVPAEVDFHTAIWDASGNEWLSVSLRRVMVPYFTYSLALSMNRPDLSRDLIYRQHTMYIQYLRSEIERSALNCVRFHVGEGA